MSIWESFPDPLADRLADDLRHMVRDYDAGADRSKQRHLGPSEIGDECTHCLAAKVLGVYEPPPFDDPWCRDIGTAIHEWLACAAVSDNPDRWLVECRVQPDTELLPSGGNADLYDAQTKTVIDHKTTSAVKLKSYRANGPGLRFRRQAHLYGKGYANQGVDVRHVALAFWQRGGRLSDLYVWTEPYDQAIADETLTRYATIRALCETGGVAVLDHLPTDPACYTCSRKPTAKTAA